MAWKFAPKLRRQLRLGWRWKPLLPLLLRPSRSTTCVKLWIKGWKSAGLFSSRRLAGRAGTIFAGRASRVITRTITKKQPGAGVDERSQRKKRQIVGGGRQSVGAGLGRQGDGALWRRRNRFGRCRCAAEGH